MQQRVGRAGSAGEALLLAVVGATLGWLVGAVVHPTVGAVMAGVATLNGLISGWRRIYNWRTRRGLVAFLLDTTWASLPILAGMVAHLIAAVSKGGYESSLSSRQNRHVYRGGAHFRSGFALTVGNVISSAGDLSRERRRKLITDHESIHIGQARCLGPLYLPLYLLWTGVGALVGVYVWFRRGRSEPIGQVVEACSYYLNPFEWWAYSRDDLWPPPGLISGFGWRQPLVRPLADSHRYGHFHDPS